MRIAAPLSALFLAGHLCTPLLAAEATRTIKLELSPADSARFRVENLAGSMKVIPATGGKVLAVATVHAESEELAGAMQFKQIPGSEGGPTLRVIYPLDRYDTIRYEPRHPEGGFAGLFGHSSTTTRYDGHRVKISGGEGVRVYADLEIQVPAIQGLEACFRNEVGSLDGSGLEGKLRFDSSSGDISLTRLRGEARSDTGSGDVKASHISGTFSCNTGSGDCMLSGFDGEKLVFDVGSGDVRVTSAAAREVAAGTGSGDVVISDSDVETLKADTGSGDVTFESRGGRLATVKADTGSGDVVLKLPAEAGFEARADQGSGDIRMGFKDAEAILHHKRVVGYRRGDSRIRIDVSTGSGDLRIEPMR
jgi:putative adhesin